MGRIIDLNTWRSLEDIQNSKTVNRKLLLASVYLTSFEILKSSIIDQVHDFFQIGYNQDRGKIYDPKYATEVLSLANDGKDKLIASALWLVEMEALTKTDVEQIADIRKHRNEIAHELHEILFYHDRNVKIELIRTIRDLVFRIDGWWIKNVEVPIHNSFSDSQIPENKSMVPFSGPVIILDLILGHVLTESGGEG